MARLMDYAAIDANGSMSAVIEGGGASLADQSIATIAKKASPPSQGYERALTDADIRTVSWITYHQIGRLSPDGFQPSAAGRWFGRKNGICGQKMSPHLVHPSCWMRGLTGRS